MIIVSEDTYNILHKAVFHLFHFGYSEGSTCRNLFTKFGAVHKGCLLSKHFPRKKIKQSASGLFMIIFCHKLMQ